jgi:hypothetical protein
MDDFYSMPWNEYLIKCFAWARMEREKWKHTRLIAYEAKIGSHLNPKSLPRSIEAYMPLGKDGKKRKSRVTPEMKALYEQRMKEYEAAKLKKQSK